MRPTKTSSWFAKLARAISYAAGRPDQDHGAGQHEGAWAATGPFFHWSDTWQLIINTGTTIATFLMVFLIQSTQNRDTESLQIKLDELIRVTEGAHNALLDLEELEESEFDSVRGNYRRLAESAREDLRRGIRDTGRASLDPSEPSPS